VNSEAISADAAQADLDYQAAILPGVSRTFALTIPVLPPGLSEIVTNAYLLCRLADTIEDDIGLDDRQKSEFHRRFVAVVEGQDDPMTFAADLLPLLSDRTLEAERELVGNTAAVIRVTKRFPRKVRSSLERCVRVMCQGMPEFQRNRSLRGLKDLEEMGVYCYYVAGVVGEMLTDLFCQHCPELEPHREAMQGLSVSFGQGLQMTNILKDVWDDREANTCWLPQSVFAERGVDLRDLDQAHDSAGFAEGMRELVGVAHGHLRNALRYTCLIPKRETGIRKFCLWAIGLSVLTLRKIHNNPAFVSGSEVKVSRRTVKATIMATNMTLMSNRALEMVFNRAADGLPLADPKLLGGAENCRTVSEVS
jgi:farnesyl-diphosphate farnesyltransferase